MTKPAWREAANERKRVERAYLKEHDPDEYRRKYLRPKQNNPCQVPGCADLSSDGRANKCEAHRFTCIVENCDQHVGDGEKYCGRHTTRVYGRSKHLGLDTPVRRKTWGGAWRVNEDGYVVRWYNGKTQLQHRYVMEQHLGRELRRDEEVHHKYGDRQDNRLESLELWLVGHQPRGQRVTDKLEHAVELIELYRDELPDDLLARIDKALTAR